MTDESAKKTVAVPADWSGCERGNTMIADGCGAYAAWLDLESDPPRRLEVTFSPASYPKLNATILSAEKSTDAALAAHVVDKRDNAGWEVIKYNLKVPLPPRPPDDDED